MQNSKKMFVKTVGKLALVAGLLGATVAVPKISSAATKAAATPVAKVKKAAVKTTQVTGIITAVNGDSLTIAPTQKKTKGTSVTVKVPATAKVTFDGKAAKLADLKAGEKATVKSKGADVVSVKASTAKAPAVKKVSKKSTAQPAVKK
jgi:hypothetical protein